MKHKILYIIAGVFCILGALCILGGAVLSDFSFSEMTGHPVTRSEFTVSSDVSKIVVQDKDAYVHVVSSLKDEISVTTLCGDGRDYTVTEDSDGEDKTVTISKVDSREWYDFIFNIDFTSQYIEIAIPKDFSCKLELSNSNGSIYVERVNCVSMAVNSEDGGVVITDTSIAEELTVFADFGAVDLTRSDIGGKADLRNDSGYIMLQSVEAGAINAVTRYGNVNLHNVTSDGDIIAENESGTISFNICSFGGKLSLTNVYGDIEGVLIGSKEDYTFRTSAVSGSNSLPHNYDGGDRLVEMYDYYGTISVWFDSDKNAPDMEFPHEQDTELSEDSATDETDVVTEDTPSASVPETDDASDTVFDIPTVTMNYLPIFRP